LNLLVQQALPDQTDQKEPRISEINDSESSVVMHCVLLHDIFDTQSADEM
tara:strand:+ start:161 stop:310 length:150 start_codon:yes stop_codon:yes gene_type:complete